MTSPYWFSNLSNEEKENVAREYDNLTNVLFYLERHDPDRVRYNYLTEFKEDIEYYVENTRADYFAYLEKNGLKHYETPPRSP